MMAISLNCETRRTLAHGPLVSRAQLTMTNTWGKARCMQREILSLSLLLSNICLSIYCHRRLCMRYCHLFD